MILAILGALALMGCLAFGFDIVQGYIRHIDSGDQAGAALGMLFLVAWFIPPTGVILTLGALQPVNQDHSPVKRRILAAVLAVGALGMLAFASLYLSLLLTAESPGGHLRPREMLSAISYTASYFGSLVGFSVLVLGCAARVGAGEAPHSPRGRGRFEAILLVNAALATLQIAAFILAGMGPGAWIFAWPGVIWIATLLGAAWWLRRREPGTLRTEPVVQ